MDELQRRARRFPLPMTDHVKLRTDQGWKAHDIFQELEMLSKEQFILVKDNNMKNPLYKMSLPPEKTVQRWCREMRREDKDPSAAPDERWNSTMMGDKPDDASIILSALSEVASHSQGHTRYFTNSMAPTLWINNDATYFCRLDLMTGNRFVKAAEFFECVQDVERLQRGGRRLKILA